MEQREVESKMMEKREEKEKRGEQGERKVGSERERGRR